MAYARRVKADLKQVAVYTAALAREKKYGRCKFMGVWQLAISDFMRSPELLDSAIPDVRGYSVDEILVEFNNRIPVVRVVITILTAGGEIIEEGEAGLTFVYGICMANYAVRNLPSKLPGMIFRVAAWDNLGNFMQQDSGYSV